MAQDKCMEQGKATNTLPIELWRIVFENFCSDLDSVTVAKLKRVCRSWNKIILDVFLQAIGVSKSTIALVKAGDNRFAPMQHLEVVYNVRKLSKLPINWFISDQHPWEEQSLHELIALGFPVRESTFRCAMRQKCPIGIYRILLNAPNRAGLSIGFYTQSKALDSEIKSLFAHYTK